MVVSGVIAQLTEERRDQRPQSLLAADAPSRQVRQMAWRDSKQASGNHDAEGLTAECRRVRAGIVIEDEVSRRQGSFAAVLSYETPTAERYKDFEVIPRGVSYHSRRAAHDQVVGHLDLGQLDRAETRESNTSAKGCGVFGGQRQRAVCFHNRLLKSVEPVWCRRHVVGIQWAPGPCFPSNHTVGRVGCMSITVASACRSVPHALWHRQFGADGKRALPTVR